MVRIIFPLKVIVLLLASNHNLSLHTHTSVFFSYSAKGDRSRRWFLNELLQSSY